MKKIICILLLLPLCLSAQKKKTPKTPKIPKPPKTVVTPSTNSILDIDISKGLKEALNNGISKQVSKLTALDGFYKNDAVKILMPQELSKLESTLRGLGMDKIAEDGIKSMNRAAEDAVKEATPIFVEAIKNMSINDAKGILMGTNDAATKYLQNSTSKVLYSKFKPIVEASIGKVGADVIWNTIINKYNNVPFVSKVNPDINDYVTNKALEGVFKMIALEELNIRTDLKSRTSPLLQSVFGLLK